MTPDRNLPALSDPQPSPVRAQPALAALTGGVARRDALPGSDSGIPWGRYFDALRRYKSFVLAAALVGSVGGVFAAQRIAPVYEARATIWVSTSSDSRRQSGPIRAAELLESSSWVELLRSFAIADSVVNKLRLYVTPALPRDSLLFASFDHTPRMLPGRYTLTTDSAAPTYALLGPDKSVLEHGAVGDSIGRRVGFRWQPPRALLAPGRSIEFVVTAPRDASMRLLENLTSILPEDGQFLRLIMTGENPHRTASTLNVWAEQFVASATELKKHNLIEFRKILESQLQVAEGDLHTAEMELERFRVQTITLPSENGPVAGGVEATRAPVLESYFERKAAYENVRQDREALETLLRRTPGKPIPADALYSIPGIVAATPPLQAALTELAARRAELRTAQGTYTDAHPRVQQLAAAVATLENETIPQITTGVLRSLREQEADLNARITGASQELRAIPTRTIEEMRLRRQVSVAENLYNTLKSRYEEAKLAEAGATPDVSVLDRAIAPQWPASNQGPRVILLAVIASVGLAVGLVLLLDRIDRRFRYPEQASDDLGLAVIGAVPRIGGRRRRAVDVDAMARLVEAFRTLRLAVRHEWPSGTPITLTISSPGEGEGKSLVAANLAVSFASAGHRVLLLDGDVRRGALHTTFGTKRGPGLVDYLAGTHALDDILQRSGSENLTFIGSGSRPVRAPELLASDRLLTLVAQLQRSYDVVIVDAPPLFAGSDPLALGVATGSMILVLRAGVSDRRLAAAKLQTVDRLPIRMLGAVLNGVEEKGLYRYYAYSYPPTKADQAQELATLAAPFPSSKR